MKKTLLPLVLILTASAVFSQIGAAQTDTLRKSALNVFMESSDYIKREITYVNYVRDIKDAGLYIISSSQPTGSGGREYTYFLVGQGQFSGMRDTLRYQSAPDDTDETTRANMVNVLKMGLMRYVQKTPLSKYISVSFTQPMAETVSTDRWNSWVFRSSVSGFLNGQKAYKSANIFGSFSARRVTEDWKINLSASYSYENDKFDISGSVLTSENNSKSISSLIVRSLNDHWSYGGSASLSSSSFSNYQATLSLMPGIEYDLFPYSESTRRQLRIQYLAGYVYAEYIDTTIYNKTRDNLWSHSLTASYEVLQKWGSIDLGVGYSSYLHDWSKNSLEVNGYFEVRIAKGLSLNLGGGGSMVHNQLNLVKGGATTEEVLLRRKELETQFRYFARFGLSYTFGSIYNNVVNPRFGGGGGGMDGFIMRMY